MRKFWIVFIVLAVIVGGGFGFMWYVMQGLEEHVSVDGGVLVWKVEGGLPEERDDSFWGQVRGSTESTFSETLFGLLRAAKDERITGLVLDIRAAELDWAKIEELRGAIGAFREQGKPVVAYLEAGFTRDYALATAADRIVLAPEANLMVLGLSAEMAFLKDTLAKLGMEADFVHVGAYKSAPERMTRSSASDANREMVESIVGDQFDALLDMLADGRGADRDEVERWVDQGLFDGQGAVAAGLADTLMYYDDMLEDEFPDDDVTFLEDYLLESPRQTQAAGKVAMVFVTGVIMPGESRFDNLQGKIAGSESIIEDLQAAADDESVDAVILRVDSPGGSALASDLIWHEIVELRKEKPVIVSMSGMAASGGYYVSCLGDSIFADKGTLTGSIGVFAGKMNRQEMYRKIGVNREFVTRGENALLFSDEGVFTDAQRTLFQAQMDGFYERFLGKVADGRKLTRDQVHEVAQGRVWTGRQGVERGLVDGVGGLERSLDAAKRRLGVDTEARVTVLTYVEPMSWMEKMLLRSLREGGMTRLAARMGVDAGAVGRGPVAGAVDLLAGGLARTLRDDGTLAAAAMLDGRALALMPVSIRIR
ncbi:MAG: signal peptide peptidase SppA [bacterium]|jgi:protease-4|nr:signal peptide peptidase SppA [bacterium]MBK9775449.1 signal peptide peptidase SppA [bacterium]